MMNKRILLSLFTFVLFTLSSYTLSAQCSHPDYAALEAFYNSTNGDNWGNNTGWLQDCDPCNGNWVGITCTDNRVTRLFRAFDGGVNGPIPPEIAGLTELKDLDVGVSNISGTLPAEIGNMTSLEEIHLCCTNLTGTLPPELGQLPNLKEIDLFSNDFSGPITPEIFNAPNLREISIQSNNFSGSIPPEIANATNLRTLNLGNCNLSGTIPSQLWDLPNIRVITLINNNFSGTIPEAIGGLIHLRKLELQNNNFSGTIPDSFVNLDSLNQLRLSENNFSGEILSKIGNYSMLFYLELEENNFSGTIPAAIGDINFLAGFDLSYNNFSGTIPEEFGDINAIITDLDLNDNDFSGCIPNAFLDLCNGFRDVNLDNNPQLQYGGNFNAFCSAGGNTDSDNDGVGDFCDNCPLADNVEQEDVDEDGTGDVCDNCPAEANVNQEDADADGRGDICDNCPADANADQNDVDLDELGDVCDPGFSILLAQKYIVSFIEAETGDQGVTQLIDNSFSRIYKSVCYEFFNTALDEIDNLILNVNTFMANGSLSTARGNQLLEMAQAMIDGINDGTIECDSAQGNNSFEQELTVNELDVQLRPNPATTEVNLQIQQAFESEITIQMYDARGVFVLERSLSPGTQHYKIDLHEQQVAAGIYYLKIAGERETLVRSFLVVR